MQFIENTRSRSSLIEFFRHFLSICPFSNARAARLQKAKAKRRRAGLPATAGKRQARRRTPKERPHAHKTSMGTRKGVASKQQIPHPVRQNRATGFGMTTVRQGKRK